MLSYTGAPKEKSLPRWIPPDLADRIGLQKPMLLPPLRTDEALEFVKDLLAHFRLPCPAPVGAYFPFQQAAIEALIAALLRKGNLKPRAIMETLDASLRELEARIHAGQLQTIGVSELKQSVERFSLDWADGPQRRRR